MGVAREDRNEHIRIYPFDIDGEELVDIRFWKNTPSGPKATKLGIAIKQSTVIKMIVALQRVHDQISSEAAHKEAGVQ